MRVSSELMKKAHKMTKEIKAEYPEVNYQVQLGLCISYLQNEEELEMVSLTGTEKQIAYAEKIRENMKKDCQRQFDKAEKIGVNKITEKHVAMANAILAHIEKETSAVWFIENNTDFRIIAKKLGGF